MRSIALLLIVLIAAAFSAAVPASANQAVVESGKHVVARDGSLGPVQDFVLMLHDTASTVVLKVDFTVQLGPGLTWYKIGDGFDMKQSGKEISADGKRSEQCLTFSEGVKSVTICLRATIGALAYQSWYLQGFYTPSTGSDWTKMVNPTLLLDGKSLWRDFDPFSKVSP
ncbi:uncharacterized protein L969DRAFT_49726 [Mixia osmundae IAM 14324]|uniref:PLAT domain-containing protein n=1 Tax=Mixia osmundae (strain CBS 9802 / IAM 14324 / JCM 22182 / KY 12970) TaxID=764103 RepID=G7E139_MIXOS|nr:uncharacterized protein L969DRAFT_49726 [Mixia osmundae IAM 14324]KEI38813.1 hypothetical protein L969DRAFT_49726 [Mixia osmundae IAM 14324]GAA96549.1 hypothetical protein E5Q_03218 [Mixia osmundae IAM 14324]